MYDATIGRWLSQDPLGFEAGDVNLYRYGANNPTNLVDPSGLQNGTNHHGYPLYLGGSNRAPVLGLRTRGHHVAAHNYLRRHGFGEGDAGRRAWAALTRRQQQAHIIRSLRAARVPNSVIRANIDTIMRGARPGVRIPRLPGFPGGRLIFSTGIGAVADVLLNPSVAGAPHPPPCGWRGRPQSDRRIGRVEIAEEWYVVEIPQFWNVLHAGGARLVLQGNPRFLNWQYVGEMTAHDARQLEGTIRSEPGTPLLVQPSAPFGYYYETRTRLVVRFNGERH